MSGGGIFLGIFVGDRICWALAWIWGARKRDNLRRLIVERQLEQIRAI